MHALLLAQVHRPLVVTSANRESEPIETLETTVAERLGDVADCFLHHNRPIVAPADDSVVRCMAGRQVTIRAARGLAPLTLSMPVPDVCQDTRLALGGHQKTAFAMSRPGVAILGPHIGELQTLGQRQRYIQQQQALQALFQIQPQCVVHDQHPEYFTTRLASELQAPRRVGVQHHHAHIVAGMIDEPWRDEQVLGFAFDGTGWGSDGTIWGGEVLLADVFSYQRVAHLRPFLLLGGEAAVRQPWRSAIALLRDALGNGDELEQLWVRLAQKWNLDIGQLQNVCGLLDARLQTWETTSMGRLFDGVSAIACGQANASYEGQPAMQLEAACALDTGHSYSAILDQTSPILLDWRPMLREIAGRCDARCRCWLCGHPFPSGYRPVRRATRPQVPPLASDTHGWRISESGIGRVGEERPGGSSSAGFLVRSNSSQ